MSHNTLIHKIASVIANPLVNTPITPNHITTIRLIMGIAAAIYIGLGETLTGVVLFVVSFVLDRADGVLARLSGKSSRIGHLFDLFSDSFCNTIFFIGLGFSLRNSDLGNWAILMGVIAGASVAAIFWLVMKAEKQAGERAAEIQGTGLFDPDDAMLFAPLLLILGLGVPLLYLASTCAPLFTIFFFRKFKKYL